MTYAPPSFLPPDRPNGLRRGRVRTILAIMIAAGLALCAVAIWGQPLKRGTGHVPSSSRVCYRATVSGPQIFGYGNLAIDPFVIAGTPYLDQGGLACGVDSVESAYQARYVAGCRPGPKAPLGGWCSSLSNETLRTERGTNGLMYWACKNRPELLNGTTGAAGGWDCLPTGRELLDLAAFEGMWRLRAIQAARDAAGGVSPPTPPTTPPAARCGDQRLDPGETCRNCPQDAGGCTPAPETPPATVDSVDCAALALGTGEQPLGVVSYRTGLASTGRLEIRLIPCRTPR